MLIGVDDAELGLPLDLLGLQMQQQGGTRSIAIIKLAGIDDQRCRAPFGNRVDRLAPSRADRIAVETTLQNEIKTSRFPTKFEPKRVGRLSLNGLPSGGAVVPCLKIG
jgi:hypothetical protein